MAHECEECGQQCYCDMDDCGGLEQPDDCTCLARHFDEDDGSEDEFLDEDGPDAPPESGAAYRACHTRGCQPEYDARVGNSYCKVCHHWIHAGPPKTESVRLPGGKE